MRNKSEKCQDIFAMILGGAFLVFILLGLPLLIFGLRESQCSKKFCPKDMKPALVHDAGCICLIEAK